MHCLGWTAMRAGPAIGPYKPGPTLGQGQFGTVKVGEHMKTHTKVALKIVPEEKTEKEKLQREIDLHQRLNHKHIVRLYDVFDHKDGTVIAMELVPGGDLLEYLMSRVRLAEQEARRLFQQMVAAISYCHCNGVVHRDIKPENILLDGDLNVKLCDFGLAAEFKEGEFLTESCGSPNYAAPELLVKRCKYTGPEVDVWSSGVVLYALLCNNLPFDAPSIPELFKQIRAGRYRVPGFVSPEAKDLIDRILTVSVPERTTIPGIVRHPWFTPDLQSDLFELHLEAEEPKTEHREAAKEEQVSEERPTSGPSEESTASTAASDTTGGPEPSTGTAPSATASPLQAPCREAARSWEKLLPGSRNIAICP